MKIDLSSIGTFYSNEIDFDKKITFIFGKNGTGKSTIAEAIGRLPNQETFVFQGFANIIDENKRLNAVVLGEENAIISKQIETKKAEVEAKNAERDAIKKSLQKPDNENESNFWTRRDKAEYDYKAKSKEIEDFCIQSASKIKNMDKPKVAQTTYNKNNFKEDISNATLISEDELNQNIETIKSEVKIAAKIEFPQIDIQELEADINGVLTKTVIERTKISRLENNAEKREFAKMGLRIHKRGEKCAFCGNDIKGATWDELVSYFSADEVKNFQNEIQNKIIEIDAKIAEISGLTINTNEFYPAFIQEAKEIEREIDTKKKEINSDLRTFRTCLDEKLKYLFEERPNVSSKSIGDFVTIGKKYDNLKNKNNENDLEKRKLDAADKIRKHYVKKALDEFEYDIKQGELNTLNVSRKRCSDEFDTEEEKITGKDGLNEKIKAIQEEIINLQSKTKNETLLAVNINKKLKHMVSFELVRVEDEESKGFYRVKDSITKCVREVTELSTGEKNIIAFLYFIEKLNEVKENQSVNPRIIVFDDPMSSNDDGMQYLIIEELQNLMKSLRHSDHFILLTHNKHFYLNVKYGHKYDKDRFIRFQSDGSKTHFVTIKNEKEDYKTSYESLWRELELLYGMDTVSADLLLNPIRRIIETYTKFNAINKSQFCSAVDGAKKLFDVNSHSIDDIEAELNGKTKNEIIQMFYDCFSNNNQKEHFEKFWNNLLIDDNGLIQFTE